MPTPASSSTPCSHAVVPGGAKPAPTIAGQKRFPGRAKCSPSAAEYRLGLMPTSRMSMPGRIRSGSVISFAASSSPGVGLRFTASS